MNGAYKDNRAEVISVVKLCRLDRNGQRIAVPRKIIIRQHALAGRDEPSFRFNVKGWYSPSHCA